MIGKHRARGADIAKTRVGIYYGSLCIHETLQERRSEGAEQDKSKIYGSVGGVGLSPSHSMLLAVWGSGRGGGTKRNHNIWFQGTL